MKLPLVLIALVLAAMGGAAYWAWSVNGRAAAPPDAAVRVAVPAALAAPRVEADPAAPPAEPVAALNEPGPYGSLPRIAEDGRRARLVYARAAADAGGRPRIAVVVIGLGADAAVTADAIEALPPDISLAFAPGAGDVAGWMGQARRDGHEVFLVLPMAAGGAAPGAVDLDPALTDAENVDRLRRALGRGTGYAGVVAGAGSAFTASNRGLRPVLTEIRNRGLMFVDADAGGDSVAATMASLLGLAQAASDLTLDGAADATAPAERLSAVETIARRNGAAVVICPAEPALVDGLAGWARGLDARGFALVPVSALGQARLGVD